MAERPYVIRALCRDCGAHVLTGLAGEWGAVAVVVDPTPLGTTGEALAQVAGRRTFALRRVARRFTLVQRDHWQIKGTPAGALVRIAPADVVAEHRCGADPLPSVPSNHHDRTQRRQEARNDPSRY